MSFRKRKNSECVPDTFFYEVSETSVRDLHGEQTLCTTRRRVSNHEHVFTPLPEQPPLGEQIKAGVSLKEIPTAGLLDSADNLDYNTEGVEEKIITTLEKGSKPCKKREEPKTEEE